MSAQHASAVCLDGQAVMLIGDSGSGKSALALSLIQTHGATLIGDDRLLVTAQADGLYVAPHARLAGLIEMRGLGLLRRDYCQNIKLALVVELVTQDAAPRLAEAAFYHQDGQDVPLLRLHGHDPHTALKIKLALGALRHGFAEDAIYPPEV